MRLFELHEVDGMENFNPLIPNGMRQSVLDAFRQFSEFQSTHPKRDETGDKKQAYVSLLISIHSSQTG